MRLLPISRICAAEIRLSYDCMHFAFCLCFHRKRYAFFRSKIRVIGKSRLML